MFKNRIALYALLFVFAVLAAACNPGGTTDPSYVLNTFTTGTGTISSDDGNIDCFDNTGDCEESYEAGTNVSLTAIAGEGFEFSGWSGETCGGGQLEADCTLTMDAEKNITATFTSTTGPGPGPDPEPVTVTIPLGPCESNACNDAEEFTSEGDEPFGKGDVDVSSSDLELNYEAEDRNVEKLVGVRFVPTLEQIPADAVISSVYIEFTPKEASSEDTLTLTIRAQTDDPAEFIPSGENLSTRSKTANGIEWSPAPWEEGIAGEATQTPDLKSLLDDIAWEAGSAVAFFFEGDGTTANRNALSSDTSIDDGPRLVVTYTLPSGS